MLRRDLLKLTGVVAGAGLLGGPAAGPSTADAAPRGNAGPGRVPRETLRLAVDHPWSVASPFGDAVRRFRQSLSRASGGRVELIDAASGEGDADAHLRADLQGTLAGDDDVLKIFAGLPGWPEGRALEQWLTIGGGASLWDEAGAAKGVKPFLLASLNQARPLWMRRSCKTVDAFRGTRLHLSGLARTIAIEALGVDAAGAANQDRDAVWQDLTAGRYDGIEGEGLMLDVARGRPSDARYLYLGELTPPDTVLGLEVPLKVWREMAPDLREIFQAVVTHTGQEMASEAQVHARIAATVLRERERITPCALGKGCRARMGEASEDTLSAIAGRSHMGTLVVNSLRGFRAVTNDDTWPQPGAGRWTRLGPRANLPLG